MLINDGANRNPEFLLRVTWGSERSKTWQLMLIVVYPMIGDKQYILSSIQFKGSLYALILTFNLSSYFKRALKQVNQRDECYYR